MRRCLRTFRERFASCFATCPPTVAPRARAVVIIQQIRPFTRLMRDLRQEILFAESPAGNGHLDVGEAEGTIEDIDW